MRFARQSAIFRGPVDPAALVGVLFLLVIFLLVGSLLYTPGVQIRFEDQAPPNAPVLTVTSDNMVVFAGKTNARNQLEDLREGPLKAVPAGLPVRLQVERGADPKLVQQVKNIFRVQLSTNDGFNLSGTDNAVAIVAINFRGQCFYDNRLVTDSVLETELRARLHDAERSARQLTLILEPDRATENDAIMRVYRLGRRAGITDFLQAEAVAPRLLTQ
jgi:biopolymer transport protein ExbD